MAAAPYIARLTLTDFRNHAATRIEPGCGLVALTGANGSGKTNLVEAVSLLSPGRGLRGDPLSAMARAGGPGGWSIAATLATADGPVEFGTGVVPGAPERRQLRVNAAAAPLASLAEWLTVLWVTPAMDRLFADTPGARRRFLDRLVLALHPGHGREVARYEAAARARSRLLAGDRPADPTWLAGLERAMAEHGTTAHDARAATVAALDAAAGDDGDFPRPRLALAGWNAATDLAAELARRRVADAVAGRATLGPHRVDLGVRFAAKDRAAGASSTGEQKALLLGLVLAHAALVEARVGRRPILILDEVGAHLDNSRRATLFARLAALGGQVWMTGADAALFDGLSGGARRFAMSDGQVD